MIITKGKFDLIFHDDTVYRRFGPNQWEKQYENFWEPVFFCDELEEEYQEANIIKFDASTGLSTPTENMTSRCLHLHTYCDTAGWHCIDCGAAIIAPVWR